MSPMKLRWLGFRKNTLSTIIDSLPVGVGIGDAAGKPTAMNKVAMNIHWLDSINDMSVFAKNYQNEYELLYPDGKLIPFVEWPVVRALRGEKVENYELCLRSKIFKKQRNVLCSVNITKNSLSQIENVVYLFQDVTEIKKAEDEFRQMADCMPHLVWRANTAGEIDYYNEKKELLGGIEKGGDVWNWRCGSHPDDFEETQQAWDAAMRNGTTYERIQRILMKDGSYRWHLSRGVPVKDNNGNVLKWYGTLTDIHDRIILEKQKDEFLRVASHELKTPITSTKAYAQVLRQLFVMKKDQASVDLLSKMDMQLNRLSVLVDDLLDVSRIESGKLKLRMQRFDANGMIRDVVADVQRMTTTHVIKVSLAPSIEIYADRERISQVLVNFLTNAIKYSPHSHEILVKSAVDAEHFKVSVQDFGIGIAPEIRKKVFDRFYRVEGDNEATYPGLGLGLFISKDIILRHRGKIWVDPTKSNGATFCFSLPVSVGVQ